jgi:hypothetical protein
VGTWHIQLYINEQHLIDAPFEVVASPAQIVNRPPSAIVAAFDPPRPATSDTLFCRLVAPPVIGDPDYDLVRYRYQWSVNSRVVRDVVTAAHADAIPSGAVQIGDTVECLVTPSDGKLSGPATRVRAVIGLSISGAVTANGAGLEGVTVSAGGRSSVTGSDGRYALGGLSAGSYTVTVTRPGYLFIPESRTVTLGSDVAGVDFTGSVSATKVSTLALNPSTVVGSRGAAATVILNGSAPAGGAVVRLASSDPVAAVPASLAVPAGSGSATFTVATAAVTTATSATISATFGGVTVSDKLVVQPIGIDYVALAPNPAPGGSRVLGIVTLEAPAPAPMVLTLTSSNPSLAALEASSVTVPAGTVSQAFSLNTAPVFAPGPVTITATTNGSSKTATLLVKP